MLSAAAAIGLLDDGFATLSHVLDGYRGHKSFSCTLVHHDSSGLFPGDYEQQLVWARGGRFELRVSKKADPKTLTTPGMAAPDYYCDGKRVLVAGPGGSNRIEALGQKNLMPGWEVSGGMILTWIMDTPNKSLFTSPPPGLDMKYSVEPEREWRGHRVMPILAKVSSGDETSSIWFYVSTDGKTYYGFDFRMKDYTGYSEVKDQAFDKPVPSDLGEGPGSRQE